MKDDLIKRYSEQLAVSSEQLPVMSYETVSRICILLAANRQRLLSRITTSEQDARTTNPLNLYTINNEDKYKIKLALQEWSLRIGNCWLI